MKPFLAVLFLTASAWAQAGAVESPADEAKLKADLARATRTLQDWPNLGRYRADNAKLAASAAGEARVVFMGDSITDGWGRQNGTFFPGKPYLNRGIGGQTTPQMLVRFRQDVIDLQPKAAVILAGTNDIAGNTGPMRLEDIEANFASLAELARAHDIKVIYASILPVHNYTPRSQDFFAQRSAAKILELNRWLKNYCGSPANSCVYLDYFSALADDTGLLKKELAEDGLHPNAAGYKIMAPLAEAAIEKTLGNQKP